MKYRCRLIWTVLLLGFFFLQTLPVWCQGESSGVPTYSGDFSRCSICKNKIENKYWVFSGNRTVCNDCYTSLPHCFRCSFPTRELTTIDGEKFCKECLKTMPRCGRCHNPMYKYYIQQDGRGREAQICSICSRTLIGNCHSCGASLLGGRYWETKSGTTGRSARCCEKCKKTAKRCYMCSLPCAPGYLSLSDRRSICSICRQTMLMSQDDYLDIFREVDDIFRNKLGMSLKIRHKFALVNLKKLNEVKKKNKKSIRETDGDTMGLFVGKQYASTDRRGRKKYYCGQGTIYILDHMPRDLAYWIVAHEYAHAWFKERVVGEKDLKTTEGFAEWIAYHVLLEKKLYTIAQCLMKNEGLYGDGARMFIDMERKRGYNATLNYAIQKKQGKR